VATSAGGSLGAVLSYTFPLATKVERARSSQHSCSGNQNAYETGHKGPYA
jgi:hypothetical protein